jgi:lipoprotein-releasing system ATP-binding protein
MIIAEGIKKSYGSLEVLKGINLEIKKSEIVSIVGASGAGKSTLLHILGTLDQADEGKVIIDGVLTSSLRKNKLSEFRNRKTGFVFQAHHLLPEFSAKENIMMPAWIAGISGAEAERRATELLSLVQLLDRKDHRPSELSGGEQQRVAVCRALINNPVVIFADEPSGNLDSLAARALHKLFFELRDRFGQTFVIVTHNEELASMADRKMIMSDGKIPEAKAVKA